MIWTEAWSGWYVHGAVLLCKLKIVNKVFHDNSPIHSLRL